MAELNLDELKTLNAQLQAAQAAVEAKKRDVVAAIAAKIEQAQALLTECETLADLVDVAFTFEYNDIATTYNEQDNWESSSYNC